MICSMADLDAPIKSIGGPAAVVDTDYARFLLPKQPDIEALAGDWNPTEIVYGSIAPDWPLCYDYAEECAAFIRMQAYRKGWAMRPAFGVLRYTMNAVYTDGPYKGDSITHAICFAVLEDLHIRYFEPQTGEWMDEPVDCKSKDTWEI